MGSTLLQWKIHMPAALMYNLCDDKYNWFYHTVPQPHCNDRVMYWPRGKVWGGSSSLNAMVYIRGHAADFDRWESEGAAGWGYAACLPYFRKAQTHQLGPDDYRGGEGPLSVTMRNWDNPLHAVFLKAGQEAGHPFTADVNGRQQEGVSWFDMTIKGGQRWNVASAYLRPAMNERGDRIQTREGVLVTKVLLDGKRAVGVEYVKDGETHRAYADKVVLSGGAINTPQLLMLSGIGPASELREAGVEVVQDLPGVGKNLQVSQMENYCTLRIVICRRNLYGIFCAVGPPGVVRGSKVQQATLAAKRPKGTSDDSSRSGVVPQENRYVLIKCRQCHFQPKSVVIFSLNNNRSCSNCSPGVWRVLPQPPWRDSPRHHVPLPAQSGH